MWKISKERRLFPETGGEGWYSSGNGNSSSHVLCLYEEEKVNLCSKKIRLRYHSFNKKIFPKKLLNSKATMYKELGLFRGHITSRMIQSSHLRERYYLPAFMRFIKFGWNLNTEVRDKWKLRMEWASVSVALCSLSIVLITGLI